MEENTSFVDLSKITMLVVDDEPFIRTCIKDLFTRSKMKVFVAADVKEAQKIISEEDVDIVLTDLQLPEEDGAGLISWMKDFDSDIAVLVISGTANISDAVRAMRAGAWDYVTKPFEPIADLQTRVERCIERREMLLQIKQYQKQMRDMVAASSADLYKLHAAVEQIAAGVFITSIDGTIEYVNPWFAASTGYSKEELIGQNPRILKSGVHVPEFYKDMWSTILNGETWSGRICNKRKDGTLYTETCKITSLKDALGNVTNFVASRETVQEEQIS
ncbi:response regulator (plasmid) [Trichlorobacter lovleyi]|uniref:PAS domain-containing response regulator n=1 Tax=Trichlorobacter lovleyi TaxID=313985 RepID=UPI0022401855|nr:response regulator [Trichlorobacter lovleyi]QOX80848.1 response regulator [Trichlorobacter lovleyi]